MGMEYRTRNGKGLARTRAKNSAAAASKSAMDFQSDEDEDAIWNRVATVKQEVNDKENRTLRLAQQTVDLGTKTLGGLATQREQLDKINQDVGATEQNLDEGDHILREMKMPWYKAVGRVLRFSPKRNAQKDVPPPLENAEGRDSPPPRSAPTTKGTKSFQFGKKPASPKKIEEQEEDTQKLDQIGALLATMQMQANEINSELKATSKKVDILVDKTADNAVKAAKNSERTKAHRKGYRERERIWNETEEGIFPGGNVARMALT